MSEVRIEKDSMGDVRVPAQAYYGAQTQRAVDNFPISGQPLPRRACVRLVAVGEPPSTVPASPELRLDADSLTMGLR